MHGWTAVQGAIFAAGSAALVFVSRGPLRVPGSHGFWRFFAWEAILALFALNLPAWFRDAFSPTQLASWALLVGSAFLVLHAVPLLRRVGKSGTRSAAAARAAGGANYVFEDTSRVVQVGAYRFIRHPMYASLLYLAWGIHLKRAASLTGWGLVLFATACLWLTARADERECLRAFGEEYAGYMERTRRFVPYLF